MPGRPVIRRRPALLLALVAVVLAGAAAAWLAVAPGATEVPPPSAPSPPGGTVHVAVDTAARFQTIAGWEATADLPEDPRRPPWQDYADEMFDRALDDVGITRIRLEITPAAETRSDAGARFVRGEIPYQDGWQQLRYSGGENDNDDPFVIDPDGFRFDELDWQVRNTVAPLRERLAARGGRLVVNLCYVDFRDGRDFQMQPEEYAEFVLAAFRHLDRTFGFVPDLWEVILEPDLPKDSWTGHDIGLAVAAAGRRLEAAGYHPAFVAPSVTDMAHAVPYLRDILAVPGAAKYLREFSYHRYWHSSDANLRGIADIAAGNGLEPAMLEFWFGRGTPAVLLDDLTLGGVVAWQGRVLNGLFAVRDRPDARGRMLDYRPEIRRERLVFRAAVPGSVRLGASQDRRAGLRAAAFRRPDGRLAVVIDAGRDTEVVLGGLDPGGYRLEVEPAEGAATQTELAAGADGSLTLPRFAGTAALVAEDPAAAR